MYSKLLKSKIEIMREDGAENLQIITDFDMTLTKAHNPDGSIASNSISVLRNNGYLSNEYVQEAKKLADHYYPIEHDLNLTIEERSRIVKEWWVKHFDLLAKCGLSREHMEDIVDNNLLILRENFLDFFELAFESKIPLLIFSAGIGEIIRLYLDKLNLKNDLVHVISNLYKYNSKGKFIGVEGEIIYSMNKNMQKVSKFPYYKQVEKRKNIILIGDSLGDLGMSEGFEYSNIIRIGFYNKNKFDDNYEEFKKEYEDNFDLVLEGDGSLESVIDLLNKILI